MLLFCLIIIPISVIRTDSNENCRFICDGIFENFFGNSVLVLDFYVQEKEIQEEPRTSKIPPPAGERQSFSPDMDYLDEKQSKFFGFASSNLSRAETLEINYTNWTRFQNEETIKSGIHNIG